MVANTQLGASTDQEKDKVLSLVEDHVIWNAMQLVHHANNVRPNPDGT